MRLRLHSARDECTQPSQVRPLPAEAGRWLRTKVPSRWLCALWACVRSLKQPRVQRHQALANARRGLMSCGPERVARWPRGKKPGNSAIVCCSAETHARHDMITNPRYMAQLRHADEQNGRDRAQANGPITVRKCAKSPEAIAEGASQVADHFRSYCFGAKTRSTDPCR